MTQTIPFSDPGPDTGAPFLDCERLDCFRVAVEFQTLAAEFVSLSGLGALRDQLDRASVSIVLNIAEGAGRRTPADKAHFFTIARDQLNQYRPHAVVGDGARVFVMAPDPDLVAKVEHL